MRKQERSKRKHKYYNERVISMSEDMTTQHYTMLIDLLKEKIYKLELDKDKQRKEINRLKKELRDLQKRLPN